jgi:polysaccharide pyruvyl transferase WcaK-like protein
MKIALFGQFGCGNSGNDGSLQAMVELLRTTVPEAELVCVCPAPDQVEEDIGIAAISSFRAEGGSEVFQTLDRLLLRLPGRLLNLLYPLAPLLGTDLVLVPGTGFLDDFREMPMGWPFMILRWSIASRLAGAKLAFVSIGAGPIRHPLSRRFMAAAARLCHYRSYRDTQSRDFMTSLGVGNGDDEVYPDLAFALGTPPASPPQDAKALRVGVGVMSYAGWMRNGGEGIYERYLDKLVAFIRWLRGQGHDIRFLTGDVQDQQALWQIIKRLENDPPCDTDSTVTMQPARTLQEIMREIAQTDIVVATRFHNVVCAMKLCRPVISLGYADKNEAALNDAGLAGYSQHVEHFDLELLKDQFVRACQNRHAIAQTLAAARARYAARLVAQAEVVARLLPRGPRSTTGGSTSHAAYDRNLSGKPYPHAGGDAG